MCQSEFDVASGVSFRLRQLDIKLPMFRALQGKNGISMKVHWVSGGLAIASKTKNTMQRSNLAAVVSRMFQDVFVPLGGFNIAYGVSLSYQGADATSILPYVPA